ncbi:MAG: ABC transporter substrate-binding protein, partial [Ruminococcus sp.]|nr:ABC transporter substrate-binding protein [Ruminococcus sp.]
INIDFDDSDTLTLFMKKSDSEKINIQKIIDLYESGTGNKIKPIIVENAEFDQKSAEAFSGGDTPDLFFDYNGSGLEELDIQKNFYYMNNEKWVDELTDSIKVNCLDRDGNVIGLPFWENSLSGCYYNKKILDSLGLRPATTQAEFDALCDALKTVGYTPLYWSSNDCNWMFQFGLDPIFADNPDLLDKLNRNEITYSDIPEVWDMITWFEKAAEKGWFNSNYAEVSWDDIAPALKNGESVLLFVWDTWFDTDFRENGKYSRDDFELMPIFMNTDNMGTYEGGNMNMLMVNKNSPRLDMALEFLDFCASPENYNIAFEDVSTVKCFKHQTTNIQSRMVTNAEVSIKAHQRASTTRLKITGYRQNDVGEAVLQLFQGKTDVEGCIDLMDKYRIANARELGTEGF